MTEVTDTTQTACIHHEADLSAVLDGEMETVDLLRTLDHLVECSQCAEFYRRSRNLDLAVASSRSVGEEGDSIEPSDAVWQRIAETAPWGEPWNEQVESAAIDDRSDSVAQVRPIRRSIRVVDWASRLAAAFVVAFGLWVVYAATRDAGSAELFRQASAGAVESSVDVLSESDLSESAIETGVLPASTEMDEERFVQLAAEVLKADPRFQQEMLRVMKTATRAESREAAVDARRVDEGRELSESRSEGDHGADDRAWL